MLCIGKSDYAFTTMSNSNYAKKIRESANRKSKPTPNDFPDLPLTPKTDIRVILADLENRLNQYEVVVRKLLLISKKDRTDNADQLQEVNDICERLSKDISSIKREICHLSERTDIIGLSDQTQTANIDLLMNERSSNSRKMTSIDDAISRLKAKRFTLTQLILILGFILMSGTMLLNTGKPTNTVALDKLEAIEQKLDLVERQIQMHSKSIDTLNANDRVLNQKLAR